MSSTTRRGEQAGAGSIQAVSVNPAAVGRPGLHPVADGQILEYGGLVFTCGDFFQNEGTDFRHRRPVAVRTVVEGGIAAAKTITWSPTESSVAFPGVSAWSREAARRPMTIAVLVATLANRVCFLSARNPSPDPRRLVKTPARATLSPGERAGITIFALCLLTCSSPTFCFKKPLTRPSPAG